MILDMCSFFLKRILDSSYLRCWFPISLFEGHRLCYLLVHSEDGWVACCTCWIASIESFFCRDGQTSFYYNKNVLYTIISLYFTIIFSERLKKSRCFVQEYPNNKNNVNKKYPGDSIRALFIPGSLEVTNNSWVRVTHELSLPERSQKQNCQVATFFSKSPWNTRHF